MSLVAARKAWPPAYDGLRANSQLRNLDDVFAALNLERWLKAR